MTKDSICKDCVSWRRIVWEEEDGNRQEMASCKKLTDTNMSDPIKVLECSEFERVQKPREWKDGKWINTK